MEGVEGQLPYAVEADTSRLVNNVLAAEVALEPVNTDASAGLGVVQPRSVPVNDEAFGQVNNDSMADGAHGQVTPGLSSDLGGVQFKRVTASGDAAEADRLEPMVSRLMSDSQVEPSRSDEGEDTSDDAIVCTAVSTEVSVVTKLLSTLDDEPSESEEKKIWKNGQQVYGNWRQGDDDRNPYEWLLTDYENPGFRHRYVEALYGRRYNEMEKVLQSDKLSFDLTPNSMIASIGSGPGAELLAAYNHFQDRKDLRFLAIDYTEGWRRYVEALNIDQFSFERMDMRQFDAMITVLKEKPTSCVVISHVLVSFPNRDIVVDLFARLHLSLRYVVVLQQFHDWSKMPHVPEGVSIKRIGSGDTALIYMKDDEVDSKTTALEQTTLSEPESQAAAY